MPKTIDTKIVEMQFDNSDFEKNVSTSVKSLKNLKSEIDAASDGDQLSGIAKSAETVANKLSTMSIVGITAIQNLTNSAINFAKRALSKIPSLINEGGKNRLLNIQQAELLFKGLGLDVEGAMNAVQKSVDGTAYSLDAAAKAAGALAASGVTDFDKLENTLRTVAGTAAVSGAAFEDISDLFARIAGQGKLMGDQLNSFNARGLNVAAFLAEYYGESEETIRTMVSKGAITFDMFTEVMTEKFQDMAGEANKTWTGILGNIRSAFARIGQDFYAPLFSNLENVDDVTNLISIGNDLRKVINKIRETTKNFSEVIYAPFIKTVIDDLHEIMRVDSEIIDWEQVAFAVGGIAGVIQNTFLIIYNTLKSIGAAFTETFGNDLLKDAVETIIDIGVSLYEVSQEAGIFEGIKSIFTALFKSIKFVYDTFKSLIGLFDSVITSVVPGTRNAFTGLFSIFATGLGKVGEFVSKVLDAITKSEIITRVFNGIKKVFEKIAPLFTKVGNGFKSIGDFANDLFASGYIEVALDKIADGFEWIVDKITILIELVRPFIKIATVVITDIKDKIVDFIKQTFKIEETEPVLDKVVGLFASIAAFITTVFGAVAKFVSPAIEIIKSFGEAFISNITDTAGEALPFFDRLKNAFGTFGETISDFFSNNTLFSDIGSWFKDKFSAKNIGGKFGSILEFVKELGKNLISAIADFTVTIVPVLGDAISEIVRSAISVLTKTAPDIFNGILTVMRILQTYIPQLVAAYLELWTLAINAAAQNIGPLVSAVLGFFLAILDHIELESILAIVDKTLDILLKGLEVLLASKLYTTIIAITKNNVYSSALSAWINKIATAVNNKSLKNFAVALLLLAGALFIMAKVDSGALLQTMAAVAEITMVLAGLYILINKLGKSNSSGVKGAVENITNAIGTYINAKALVSIAEGILVLAAAMFVISKIDSDRLWESFGVIAALMGVLAITLGALSILNQMGGKSLQKAQTAILGFSVAIYIMAKALKNLAVADPDKIGTALILLAGSLALFVITMWLLNKEAGNTSKTAAGLILFSVALNVLAIALTALGQLSMEQIKVGLLGISGSLLAIAVLAAVVGKSDTSLVKVALGVMLFSASLLVLSLGLAEIGSLKPDQLIKSVATIGVLLGLLGGFTYFVSQYPPQLFFEVAAGIAIFSAAVLAMSIGLSILAGAGLGGTMVALVGLAGSLAILFAAVAAFAYTGLTDNLVMVGFSIAMIGAGALAVSKAILTLTAALMLLGLAGPIVAPGLIILFDAVFPAIARGIVTIIDTIVEGIITLAPKVKDALVGLLKSALQGIVESADTIFTSVVQLLDSLVTYMPQIIDKVGTLIVQIINGLATKLPEIMKAIHNFLKALIDSITQEFSDIDLSGIVAGMSQLAQIPVMLALAGKLGIGAGLKGIVILVALAVALVGLLAIFAKLNDWIPGVADFLREGIPILEVVADAIGTLVGHVLSAILESITESALSTFDSLGAHLSAFMINLQPFIDGAKSIDITVLEGVGIIVATILALTVGELIAAIGSFLGGSFSMLGMEMVAFAGYIVAFAGIIQAADLNLDQLNAAAACATAMGTLAMAIPGQGGLLQKLMGTKDIDDFGQKVVGFAGKMIEANDVIQGKTFDKEAFESAAEAVGPMVELANEIPKTGGFIEKIIGSNDIDDFGVRVVKFIAAIINADEKLREAKDFKVKTFEDAEKAGIAMVNVANAIPNSGGVVSWFTGGNDIDKFGDMLVSFAGSIVKFSTEITKDGGINTSAIISSANAGMALTKLADSIPNSDGVVSWFTGGNDIDKFGEMIVAFAEGITAYNNILLENPAINKLAVSNSVWAAGLIVDLSKELSNSGGVSGFFSGNNDLDTFANQLPVFGEGLASYNKSIVEAKINKTAISNSVAAARFIVDLSKELSNSGGVAGFFAGNNDLDTFGLQLPAFGSAIASYSRNVAGISYDEVAASHLVIRYLIDSIRSITAADIDGTTNFSKALSGISKANIEEFIYAFKDIKTKEDLANAVSELLIAAGTEISSSQTTLREDTKTAVEGIILAAGDLEILVKDAFIKIAKKGSSAINNQERKDDFYTAGVEVVNGFINGVNSKQYDVWNAGYALGKAAEDGARVATETRSPSRLFAQLGEYNGEGYANGMYDSTKLVGDAAENMGNVSLDRIRSMVGIIAAMVENGIDAQPTIRPVMDMTQLQNGLDFINKEMPDSADLGMMSYRLSASVDPYQQLTGRERIYNDSKVVSAIIDLNSRMDSLGQSIANMKIMLDTGALVGGISEPMNQSLGRLSVRANRGG